MGELAIVFAIWGAATLYSAHQQMRTTDYVWSTIFFLAALGTGIAGLFLK